MRSGKLRKVSTFISAFTSLSEPRLPRDRLERIGQTHRRRLDDIIEEAFQHACVIGDLDTATELVEVVERKHARWQRAHNMDRREDTVQLKRMQEEAARRRRLKAHEAAAAGANPVPFEN